MIYHADETGIFQGQLGPTKNWVYNWNDLSDLSTLLASLTMDGYIVAFEFQCINNHGANFKQQLRLIHEEIWSNRYPQSA